MKEDQCTPCYFNRETGGCELPSSAECKNSAPLHRWGYMFEKSGDRNPKAQAFDQRQQLAWNKDDNRFRDLREHTGQFFRKDYPDRCKELKKSRGTEAVEGLSNLIPELQPYNKSTHH